MHPGTLTVRPSPNQRVHTRRCATALALALLNACGSEVTRTPPQDAEGEGESSEDDDCPAVAAEAGSKPPPTQVTLPPATGSFDYQLGCPYRVPAGASAVSRDRGAPAVPGIYNICYVNAFQTQPDSDWSGERDALILRDARGRKVGDPDWPDEYVLDLSSPAQRAALLEIAAGWIAECAAGGFDAVELDNLDTFTRFPDLLALESTLAYAADLVSLAHDRSLAVAQKNTAEESARLRALGFDFVVAEQCWEYSGDCELYTAEYGTRVFDVEYDVASFERGCNAGRAPVPILRDLELRVPGPSYVRRECP